MVAIVSGNSLGLDLTSLRTLGSQEFTGNAVHGRAQGTYVNAATGNLVVQAVDGFAVGGGPDIQALRTYNSQGLLNDDNGDNWSSGVFLQPLQVVGVLNAVGSTIARTGRDGAVAIYTFDTLSQEYLTTQGDGAYGKITFLAAEGHLEWRDGSTGVTQTYEASGAYRLLFETNPDKEKLTYTYTGVRLDSVLTEAGEGTHYLYDYDDLNRLTQVERDGEAIDKRRYDAADRVLRSGGTLTTEYLEQLNRLVESGHAGRPDVRINRYDANGRLLHQTLKRGDGGVLQDISWDPTEAAREVPTSVAGAYRAEGYDHAGNVKGYTVFTHEGSRTSKYSTTLERFEGYVGAHSSVTDSSSGETGTNEQGYDANGHLVRVDDDHLTGNSRTFVNDAQGRALSTVRGGHVQRQLIVNGEVMGRYGVGVHDMVPLDADGYPNFTNVADFNFSFARISPTNPAPSPGAYIVRADETLQTIARGAYGDAALWYLIAQANGLSSNDDVRVGQVLNIPNRVGTVHNNEGTFKPYDPSKITGDLAPSLPLPGERCGSAGQVLMLIVAIVVTIYTAGAGAAALSTTAGASASFGTVMSTGAGVLMGSGAAAGTALGTVGTLALAGGVGAAAGQMVGVATGTIEDFDFKAVALAAIGGAIGGSLSGVKFVGNAVIDGIVRAAAGNIITQGIATATGLQSSFNWRSVAAAAVGSAVGQAVGKIAGTVFESSPFMARLTTGLVAGATAAAVRGGKVAVLQVAVDAFGNALGQSIAESAIGVRGVSEWSGAENTPQQNFRKQEIGEQNAQARADALYGWNTGNHGLGFKPIAGISIPRMRYQGMVSDDLRTFSDSTEPKEIGPVRGEGESPFNVANVGWLFSPANPANPLNPATGGTRGYLPIRPDGAGAPPPYVLDQERSSGAPGYALGNPSLGLGAPPQHATDKPWFDRAMDGMPMGVKALSGLMQIITTKVEDAFGSTRTRNGYSYGFDDGERVTNIKGDLRSNPDQIRNPQAQLSAGGRERLPNDDGGHYIGRRFDGPTDDFNHFAQDRNFNRSAYKELENSWQRALDAGKKVSIDITPSYDGSSVRPIKIQVDYTIDGVPYSRSFTNRHGG